MVNAKIFSILDENALMSLILKKMNNNNHYLFIYLRSSLMSSRF